MDRSHDGRAGPGVRASVRRRFAGPTAGTAATAASGPVMPSPIAVIRHAVRVRSACPCRWAAAPPGPSDLGRTYREGMTAEDFRVALAAARSLEGVPPPFDVAATPSDPMDLFRSWFLDAVRAGVPEPHTMTLSTVDAAGRPDARVLILKAVDGDRMAFAGGAESAKGRELAAQPSAALTFWWQPLRRSVRIRGSVVEGSAEEHREDLARRGADARAAALVSGDAPLGSRAMLEAEARAADPHAHDARWRRWWLVPDSVEFWQGDPGRLHHRLRYDRTPSVWGRRLLRP